MSSQGRVPITWQLEITGAQEVKARMQELQQQFSRGEINANQYARGLRGVSRDAAILARNNQINTRLFLAQHPALNALSRGMSGLASVMHTVVAAQNAMNLAMLTLQSSNAAVVESDAEVAQKQRELASVREKFASGRASPKELADAEDALTISLARQKEAHDQLAQQKFSNVLTLASSIGLLTTGIIGAIPKLIEIKDNFGAVGTAVSLFLKGVPTTSGAALTGALAGMRTGITTEAEKISNALSGLSINLENGLNPKRTGLLTNIAAWGTSIKNALSASFGTSGLLKDTIFDSSSDQSKGVRAARAVGGAFAIALGTAALATGGLTGILKGLGDQATNTEEKIKAIGGVAGIGIGIALEFPSIAPYALIGTAIATSAVAILVFRKDLEDMLGDMEKGNPTLHAFAENLRYAYTPDPRRGAQAWASIADAFIEGIARMDEQFKELVNDVLDGINKIIAGINSITGIGFNKIQLLGGGTDLEATNKQLRENLETYLKLVKAKSQYDISQEFRTEPGQIEPRFPSSPRLDHAAGTPISGLTDDQIQQIAQGRALLDSLTKDSDRAAEAIASVGTEFGYTIDQLRDLSVAGKTNQQITSMINDYDNLQKRIEETKLAIIGIGAVSPPKTDTSNWVDFHGINSASAAAGISTGTMFTQSLDSSIASYTPDLTAIQAKWGEGAAKLAAQFASSGMYNNNSKLTLPQLVTPPPQQQPVQQQQQSPIGALVPQQPPINPLAEQQKQQWAALQTQFESLSTESSTLADSISRIGKNTSIDSLRDLAAGGKLDAGLASMITRYDALQAQIQTTSQQILKFASITPPPVNTSSWFDWSGSIDGAQQAGANAGDAFASGLNTSIAGSKIDVEAIRREYGDASAALAAQFASTSGGVATSVSVDLMPQLPANVGQMVQQQMDAVQAPTFSLSVDLSSIDKIKSKIAELEGQLARIPGGHTEQELRDMLSKIQDAANEGIEIKPMADLSGIKSVFDELDKLRTTLTTIQDVKPILGIDTSGIDSTLAGLDSAFNHNIVIRPTADLTDTRAVFDLLDKVRGELSQIQGTPTTLTLDAGSIDATIQKLTQIAGQQSILINPTVDLKQVNTAIGELLKLRSTITGIDSLNPAIQIDSGAIVATKAKIEGLKTQLQALIGGLSIEDVLKTRSDHFGAEVATIIDQIKEAQADLGQLQSGKNQTVVDLEKQLNQLGGGLSEGRLRELAGKNAVGPQITELLKQLDDARGQLSSAVSTNLSDTMTTVQNDITMSGDQTASYVQDTLRANISTGFEGIKTDTTTTVNETAKSLQAGFDTMAAGANLLQMEIIGSFQHMADGVIREVNRAISALNKLAAKGGSGSVGAIASKATAGGISPIVSQPAQSAPKPSSTSSSGITTAKNTAYAGQTFMFGSIPITFAAGGMSEMLNSPRLILAGENGPEYVNIIPTSAKHDANAGFGVGSGGGGSSEVFAPSVTIIVQGSIRSDKDLIKIFEDYFTKSLRSRGIKGTIGVS